MSVLQKGEYTKAFQHLAEEAVGVKTDELNFSANNMKEALAKCDKFIELNKIFNILTEDQITLKAHSKNEHELIIFDATEKQIEKAWELSRLRSNGLSGELTQERITKINEKLNFPETARAIEAVLKKLAPDSAFFTIKNDSINVGPISFDDAEKLKTSLKETLNIILKDKAENLDLGSKHNTGEVALHFKGLSTQYNETIMNYANSMVKELTPKQIEIANLVSKTRLAGQMSRLSVTTDKGKEHG